MYRQALFSLSLLFFMMGFITCLNDILVPYLKSVFELGFTQAALVQFCFFGAYGLMSIPSSKLIEKVGYQKGMVVGFVIASLGCLLFYPAVMFHRYPLFLLALFVLATGIVMLQVAANPFVSILGPKESASSRLTMAQAFNSFGTFIAPFIGSIFILSKMKNLQTNGEVKYPYVVIALILMVIAFYLSRIKFPKIDIHHESGSWREVLKTPNVIFGMVGIFAYVGAEVSIGSFLVNYVIMMQKMPETQAANLVAIYWGSSMAGRFLGIFTLKEFIPGKVLNIHALLAIALILVSINSKGDMAIYSIILVGFCNSIMFPTIFTLGLQGMEKSTQKVSGLMGTAILGGAVVPMITGQMADYAGLRMAFAIPTLCYLYIALFGSINTRELATETI